MQRPILPYSHFPVDPDQAGPMLTPQDQLRPALNSRWGGGGGQCTASLKVGTHCQITAPAFWPCQPLSLLWPPPVFEGHRPPPPKIRHPQYKITYKTDTNYFSKISIQWIPCISQNRVKTNTSYKLLPLLGSQFEVDRPPFLPSKGLTAPRFCHSPAPLRAAVWQWVVIQYLSAPPGSQLLRAAPDPTVYPNSRGGGHSGTEWLPIDKRPHRAESINSWI